MLYQVHYKALERRRTRGTASENNAAMRRVTVNSTQRFNNRLATPSPSKTWGSYVKVGCKALLLSAICLLKFIEKIVDF